MGARDPRSGKSGRPVPLWFVLLLAIALVVIGIWLLLLR